MTTKITSQASPPPVKSAVRVFSGSGERSYEESETRRVWGMRHCRSYYEVSIGGSKFRVHLTTPGISAVSLAHFEFCSSGCYAPNRIYVQACSLNRSC